MRCWRFILKEVERGFVGGEKEGEKYERKRRGCDAIAFTVFSCFGVRESLKILGDYPSILQNVSPSLFQYVTLLTQYHVKGEVIQREILEKVGSCCRN